VTQITQGTRSIGRVPAAEIEALVMTALRNHLQANGTEAVLDGRGNQTFTGADHRHLPNAHVKGVALRESFQRNS
jgi:hypothetical protein